jgi:hypothetical protein
MNSYLERKHGGRYEGALEVDGVNLSPIEGTYFKERNRTYLWIKRKPVLEYDDKTKLYRRRDSVPKCEIYMEKQNDGVVAYKGKFFFLRIKYLITGVWDGVLGTSDERLNLYVERLPKNEQTVINAISDRNRNE